MRSSYDAGEDLLGVGTDAAAMRSGALAPGQRWSASRKRDVVLGLLRGEPRDEVSRGAGSEGGGRWAAGRRAGCGQATHRGAVDGERAVAVACRSSGAPPPFGDVEVATMSQAASARTGRRYGLERVCPRWERSRSALYARRARMGRSASADSPRCRGPTPALSDAQLLAAIRRDLARSQSQGEGHRKVHARLRIIDGIRVSRTRILRVMRAGPALAPPRASG